MDGTKEDPELMGIIDWEQCVVETGERKLRRRYTFEVLGELLSKTRKISKAIRIKKNIFFFKTQIQLYCKISENYTVEFSTILFIRMFIGGIFFFKLIS